MKTRKLILNHEVSELKSIRGDSLRYLSIPLEARYVYINESHENFPAATTLMIPHFTASLNLAACHTSRVENYPATLPQTPRNWLINYRTSLITKPLKFHLFELEMRGFSTHFSFVLCSSRDVFSFNPSHDFGASRLIHKELYFIIFELPLSLRATEIYVPELKIFTIRFYLFTFICAAMCFALFMNQTLITTSIDSQ